MRIAVLCSDLGIRVPGKKGASLHLCAIAAALARTGNEVMIVGVAGHGPPPAGMGSLLLPHPGRSKGLRRELRKLSFVRHITNEARAPLADFRPDVIYERLSLFGTAGRRLASELGVPHVVEVNALLAEEEARWRGLRLGRLAARREHMVLDGADLRVGVSAELAERLPAPCAVVPNGVEARLFERLADSDDARRRFHLPANLPVIGFAGGLRPWHGVETAIAALPQLSGAVLAVAGAGPQREALERDAAERGVAERVRWLGALPHADIPVFLAALDAAVLPYPPLRDFGFSPLKLYEYLAAGAPVVASDIGQVRAVLEDGRWGALVPAGDVQALAATLREQLADPGPARARAAEARRHTLQHDSWDERARRLGELLAERSGALAV